MQLLSIVPLVGLAMACLGGCGPGGLVVPGSDVDPLGVSTGTDGTAYPTENIGGRPRTSTQPGQIFPNLTLEGIRSVSTIDQPAVVSMAEFYDPSRTRLDLLHITAIFMWCPHCRNETEALMEAASFRAERRVAVLQIAMQSNSSASPTWSDMQRWVREYGLDFPLVVDGQGAELGRYFEVSSVPVNIVVDPRTMEILAVRVGEVANVEAYEQGFLDSK